MSRACSAAATGVLRARRLRRPRHRGHDPRRAVRPRERRALSRHLPRYADRRDRVCAPRTSAGPTRTVAEFDSGTAHPVIDADAGPDRRDRQGRHDASRASTPACSAERQPRRRPPTAPREISERHRHRYEFNNLLTARSLSRAGMTLLRHSRRTARLVEIAELPANTIWYRRLPVPPRIQEPPRPSAPALHRLRRRSAAQGGQIIAKGRSRMAPPSA